MEEQSNWGGATVKTNKFSMIRSGGGINSNLNSEMKEQ